MSSKPLATLEFNGTQFYYTEDQLRTIATTLLESSGKNSHKHNSVAEFHKLFNPFMQVADSIVAFEMQKYEEKKVETERVVPDYRRIPLLTKENADKFLDVPEFKFCIQRSEVLYLSQPLSTKVGTIDLISLCLGAESDQGDEALRLSTAAYIEITDVFIKQLGGSIVALDVATNPRACSVQSPVSYNVHTLAFKVGKLSIDGSLDLQRGTLTWASSDDIVGANVVVYLKA